jgi:hypothetical protein
VIAFCATGTKGKSLLYTRLLNAFTAQAIPGTEGAMDPFWSPDSKSIGFFSEGKLKRVELSGGQPQTVCEARANGGAWNQNGEIIFAQPNQESLSRISISGGLPVLVTTLAPGDVGHVSPQFLPDGQHFIYYAANFLPAQRGMYISSLSGDAPKQIVNSDYAGAYGGGYLLFSNNDALMGQPFDIKALKLTGKPFLIADQIKLDGFGAANYYSLSESGSLIFQGIKLTIPKLIWFDRSGKQLGAVGDPADYSSPSLSPDGKRLAIGIRDPQTKKRDIWLFDLLRGTKSRFTFDPADDLNPVWTPDASRILFTSDRKGQRDLFQKKVNTMEEEELLYSSPEIKNTEDLSPDGSTLVFNTSPGPKDTTKNDIWLFPLIGERRPSPFIKAQSNEFLLNISPDGKWLAYTSDESGTREVYVTTFPQPTGKWQVSAGSGQEPKWRRDGKELYFLASDKKLMAVDVNTNLGVIETGVPRVLFEAPFYLVSGKNRFVVTNDGQRFLTILQEADTAGSSLNVVVNWKAGIKR